MIIIIGEGEDAKRGCSFNGKEVCKKYSGPCEQRNEIHVDDFIPSAFMPFK